MRIRLLEKMDLVQTSVKCGQAEITKNGIDPFFLNSSRVVLLNVFFFLSGRYYSSRSSCARRSVTEVFTRGFNMECFRIRHKKKCINGSV